VRYVEVRLEQLHDLDQGIKKASKTDPEALEWFTNMWTEVRAFRASRSISSNFIKTINFSDDYYNLYIYEFIYRIIENYFKGVF